jgi:hypothetical protein
VVILAIFAVFASIGFGRSLVALLWMSTILSAVIGAVRREPPFDTVLNHWDETALRRAVRSGQRAQPDRPERIPARPRDLMRLL